MKKTISLFVIAGVLLSTCAFAATTYTDTVYKGRNGKTGFNWIGLKGVPFNPEPAATTNPDGSFVDPINDSDKGVFWQGDIDSTLMLIDNNTLIRLDATSGNPVAYSSMEPGFGKCLLGEGYTVLVTDNVNHPLSYAGVDDGVPSDLLNPATTQTDMWVSLPGKTGAQGGWQWVGSPFNHNVQWVDCKVTNGSETLYVEDAVSAGWLQDGWLYWDGATQNPYAIDPFEGAGSQYLEPGRMYKVKTNVPNLALIIPAYDDPDRG